MPGPWEDFKANAVSDGPWSDYSKETKGPRQYSPSSEKRGKHSLTGREARPRSGGEQALDLAEGTTGIIGAGTALPALVFNPVGTIAGVAGGAVAGYGGKSAAEAAGVGPVALRAIGDVAGLAGGAAAGKYGARAVSALTPEFISKRISGLGDYLTGIKDRWNASAPKTAKPPIKRPEPAWKSGPGPANEAPPKFEPIKATWTPRTVVPKSPPVPREVTSRLVKPESYRSRGERNPEDLDPADSPTLRGRATEYKGQSQQKDFPKTRHQESKLPTPSGNASAAEQIRDELGGPGDINQETGVKTIPQPEDVRAADRVKLSPRGKKSMGSPQSGANASPHPERSGMLAEALKAVGFTPEAAKTLKPEDWHAIAQQVGIDTPDQATVDAAIKSLK